VVEREPRAALVPRFTLGYFLAGLWPWSAVDFEAPVARAAPGTDSDSWVMGAAPVQEGFCDGESATEASLVRTRKTNVSWR
jgi:hypothetical protein